MSIEYPLLTPADVERMAKEAAANRPPNTPGQDLASWIYNLAWMTVRESMHAYMLKEARMMAECPPPTPEESKALAEMFQTRKNPTF